MTHAVQILRHFCRASYSSWCESRTVLARKWGSNGTVLGMVLTSWSRKMARFCRRQIMSKSFQSLRLYLRRLLQKYNGGMHGARTTPWTAQAPASSEQDPAVPTAAPFHWLQAPRRPPADPASSFSYQPAETVTILLAETAASHTSDAASF